MTAVFAVFVLTGVPSIKELGLGCAVAIALDATLVRAVGFFPFASAYWALLPLVARTQMHNGPEVYGILLGIVAGGLHTCLVAVDGRLRSRRT